MLAANADRIRHRLESLPCVIIECLEELCCTAFDEREDDVSLLEEFRDVVAIHLRRAELSRFDAENGREGGGCPGHSEADPIRSGMEGALGRGR